MCRGLEHSRTFDWEISSKRGITRRNRRAMEFPISLLDLQSRRRITYFRTAFFHAPCTGITRLSPSSFQSIIPLLLVPIALARRCAVFRALCLQRLRVPLRQTAFRQRGRQGASRLDFRSSAHRLAGDTRSRYARITARSPNWVTARRGETAFSCPWENAACWRRPRRQCASVFIDQPPPLLYLSSRSVRHVAPSILRQHKARLFDDCQTSLTNSALLSRVERTDSATDFRVSLPARRPGNSPVDRSLSPSKWEKRCRVRDRKFRSARLFRCFCHYSVLFRQICFDKGYPKARLKSHSSFQERTNEFLSFPRVQWRVQCQLFSSNYKRYTLTVGVYYCVLHLVSKNHSLGNE